VGEVLLDVIVLGPLLSSESNDVVSPLDVRGVIIVYRCRLPLSKFQVIQEKSEV
jgi:hypothetical protein